MKRYSDLVSAMSIFCLVALSLIVSNKVLGQETLQGKTDAQQESTSPTTQVQGPKSGQTEVTPSYSLAIGKAGSGQGKVWTTPQGANFKKGTVVTIYMAPDPNSIFDSWSGACSGSNRMCTVTMTGDKAVTASFALKTYTIHVRSPVNGVIHPFGAVKVIYGEKRRFQIIPLPGYRVSEVFVDRTSVGAVNTYTFNNITSDHTFEAVFIKE
jgi:hypothetical protein